MAEALAALRFLPPIRLQVNNRKLIEGFYRGVGAPDVAAVMRAIDKLDKAPPDVVAEAAASSEAGLTDGQAAVVPRAGRRSAAPTCPSSSSVQALGVDYDLLDDGLAELAAVIEGCARPSPASRSRRTCASPAAWTTTPGRSSRRGWWATSRSARSAPAAATTRWPPTARTTYPGVGISLGVTRLLDTAVPAGRARRLAVGPVRRARRACLRTTTRRRLRRGRAGAAGARHLDRGRPVPAEVRQADPLCRPARHPVRVVPRRRAPTRSRTSAAATRWLPTRRSWSPPPADLRPQVIVEVVEK